MSCHNVQWKVWRWSIEVDLTIMSALGDNRMFRLPEAAWLTEGPAFFIVCVYIYI